MIKEDFILSEFNDFVLVNIYILHGGRRKENHHCKFAVLDNLLEFAIKINKNVIICTDFNIVHTEKS